MSLDDTAIPTEKRCSQCGVVKPLDEFVTRSKSRDGKTAYCKACGKAAHDEYRRLHREEERQRSQQWKRDHREQHNASKRRQRSARHDYYRERYREWCVRNKGKRKEYGWKYDRRIKELPFTFTAEDWQYALSYFGNCCAVCGRQPGLWHTLAADHWIPISSPDCPGTVPHNIVPLCHGMGGCNNSKGNKEPKLWLIERFGKKKAAVILKRIEAYLDSRRLPDEATA